MKNLFLITATGFLMGSCASFLPGRHPVPLRSNDVLRIEGTYDLASKIDSVGLHTMYDELYRPEKNWEYNAQFKGKTVATSFSVDILDSKYLEVRFLDGSDVVETKHMRYRVRKNFVYVRNKNLHIMGVPMIFGGYDCKRVRFAVGANG